jgi:AAA ATPase domain/AAA domain
MRVSKILIKGFQQFENFQLDLTHPETGEPLEKICLIGPNGTGKTTLLGFVIWMLIKGINLDPLMHLSRAEREFSNIIEPFMQMSMLGTPPSIFLGIKLHLDSSEFWMCHVFGVLSGQSSCMFYYDISIEDDPSWSDFLCNNSPAFNHGQFEQYRVQSVSTNKLENPYDVLIHEPSDQSTRLASDPPNPSLSESLGFFHDQPFYSISVAVSASFWKLLIYLENNRENEYRAFLKQDENRKRIVEEVDLEFDNQHPRILPELGRIWSRILDRCGLEFDWNTAKLPARLNETMEAYIKSKKTSMPLLYNQLSSGIRNYIFKIGYLKALYFDRQIKRGFLLIDEPENCLYPDLLYDLMDDYWSIIENTQTFVSTHSPIIAAQFEPYERFHLDFDDRGYVTATRGVSPIGDDPNDLLYRDFQVRSIYGKKGLEKWERFRELRQLIRATDDPAAKEALMSEYTEIANAYNFPVPR